MEPELTVVIPVYNEEESLPPLFEALMPVLEALGRSTEVLLVDDGSTDGSLDCMRRLRARHPGVRILRHERNAGLSAAMATGFAAARGAVVATMDADLQNDPRDIPLLLEALREADAVVGWRHERNDPFVKRLSSRVANWLRNRVIHDGIHDTGCSLKVYRREYLGRLRMYTGLHRFLPALLQMEGARVREVKVRHHPRTRGTAKYHLTNRLAGPLYDLIVVRWMQRRRIAVRAEELP